MRLDSTDWGQMSLPQQIRHFEVESYVVLPEIVPRDVCEKVKEEMASGEMGHTDDAVEVDIAGRE